MYNENKAAGQTKQLTVDKNSKFYHLFNFLQQEYENDLEKMMKRISNMLTLGVATRFIKNEKWRKRIQYTQGLISAGMFTTDFIMHVKNYIKTIKNEQNSVYDKRMVKVCKILEIPENNPCYGNLPHQEVYMNPDILNWVLNKPNTKNFKISRYINIDNNEDIIPNTSESQIKVGVLILIKDQKILWDIEAKLITGSIFITNSFILGECIENNKYITSFRQTIISDYIEGLDTKKNALFFDNWGYLYPKERRSVQENINQYDINTLIYEIREVLNKKRRRAYAFVGRQGVGKSAILRKIEELITEYVVIHLSPSDFSSGNDIRDRFEIIKSLQPAIVIIEDLDACGIKDKNRLTGDFLNCIDEINKDLNIILIVSINDTSSVHYTVLNRPGRFDRIEEIKSPQTIKEIKEVITSKINAIKNNYCTESIEADNLLKNKKINRILRVCLDSKFTQAEITNAIIEQTFIDINIKMTQGVIQEKWSEIKSAAFAEYVEKSVIKHFKTKEALKNCNFNNKNPEEVNVTTPDACGTKSRSYGGSNKDFNSYYEHRFKKNK